MNVALEKFRKQLRCCYKEKDAVLTYRQRDCVVQYISEVRHHACPHAFPLPFPSLRLMLADSLATREDSSNPLAKNVLACSLHRCLPRRIAACVPDVCAQLFAARLCCTPCPCQTHPPFLPLRALAMPFMQVCDDYRLSPQSAWTAMNYFDRYLGARGAFPVERNEAELVSLTCLLLAAKFLERQSPVSL